MNKSKNTDIPNDYDVLAYAIDELHRQLENWLAIQKQMEHDVQNKETSFPSSNLETARRSCEIAVRHVYMIARFTPQWTQPESSEHLERLWHLWNRKP